MIWKRIFGRSRDDDTPYVLYGLLVTQARSPVFYTEMGVPDTAEGRFEMVALHVHLALRRLRAGGQAGKELGQKLFDVLFDDMDQTLREMGVGDLSVGKKIKALAQSFYGRMQAYDEALADDGDKLEAALRRNILPDTATAGDHAARLAAYGRQAEMELAAQPVEDILLGRVVFTQPGEAEIEGAS
ncbi:ubiquinol-cytochrome C chaperone family protein [Parvibaculum sp.]|uniref:ubiquinol-cytochrome C chaperone family protein n=1 Tax=Parvibaculum sp. TaxID=2024848 RepID=UPI00391B6CEB